MVKPESIKDTDLTPGWRYIPRIDPLLEKDSGSVLSGLGSSFLAGGKRSAAVFGSGLETGAVRVGRKTLIVASAASQSKKSWIPAVKGGNNFLDSEWLDGS
uniref:Chlorophyll a-b binding protein, chloroplastic n=1 Tax=Brassica oleracea TaxID=3712 RepID=A0A3P6CPD9_BRAOL|nr:unnamed protein product [Brassica oleracea]